MIHVAFLVNDLLDGGAGRVTAVLANGLLERGYQVSVLTTDDGTASDNYKLKVGIRRVHLGLRCVSRKFGEALVRNLRRAMVLRRTLKECPPTVVISFIDVTNVLSILATRGLNIPVIVSERTDPNLRSLPAGWEVLRSICYPAADAVVCQTQRAVEYFPKVVKRRCRIIPNPVPAPGRSFSRSPTTDEKLLISLGSLRPEKGYDLLLRAFSSILPKHPEWSVVIWGDGAGRRALESLARSLGIETKARFPGRSSDPYACLAEGDLFVLPSRVEGFPNALCEAMSMGLAVVATDVGAVSEIIRPGVDGVIVPREDVSALAAKLSDLMGDEKERSRLGMRARGVAERFSVDNILTQWEMLMHACLGRRGQHKRRFPASTLNFEMHPGNS
jgi:glycosyltransferase involved in cell wall biosynthesis